MDCVSLPLYQLLVKTWYSKNTKYLDITTT